MKVENIAHKSHYEKKRGLNQGKSRKDRNLDQLLNSEKSSFSDDFSECLNNPVTPAGSAQENGSGKLLHCRECIEQCNWSNSSDSRRQLLALKDKIQKTIAGKSGDRLVQGLFSGHTGMGTQIPRFGAVLRADKGGVADKNLACISRKDIGKRSAKVFRNINGDNRNIRQQPQPNPLIYQVNRYDRYDPYGPISIRQVMMQIGYSVHAHRG